VNAKPGVLSSAIRVFDFSLGQMLWSRRSVFLALLVGAPMAIAFAIRMVAATRGLPVINGAGLSGPTLFGILIWLLFVRFVVPVLGVFYGTSLIADEVDDKTITYLFTRPVPRSAVLIGKYLSYLACVVMLVLPSVVVVYFLIVPIGGHIGEAFPSLAADLGMLIVGLASYGAVFALVGAWLKRPLIIGLVFAFGWENTVLVIPGEPSAVDAVRALQDQFIGAVGASAWNGVAAVRLCASDGAALRHDLIHVMTALRGSLPRIWTN